MLENGCTPSADGSAAILRPFPSARFQQHRTEIEDWHRSSISSPADKGHRAVGAQLVIRGDGVDLTSTDNPTRRLIRQVLGAVAEFEKNVIVLKLRMVHHVLARR